MTDVTDERRFQHPVPGNITGAGHRMFRTKNLHLRFINLEFGEAWERETRKAPFIVGFWPPDCRFLLTFSMSSTICDDGHDN